jgi:hypothetical protein
VPGARRITRRPYRPPGGRRRGRREFTPEAFIDLEKRAILLAIFLFCLIHWVIRVLLFPNFSIEEAERILASQGLQAGYRLNEPPMLSWLYWAATKTFGYAAPVLLALKHMMLWAGLSLYFLSARTLLTRPAPAAAALGAWALTFVLGWGVQEDLLSITALFLCLALCLHALSRILAERRGTDFIYLGLSIGVGALTHHLFLVFPVAALAAILLCRTFRDELRPWRIALVIAISLVSLAPYLFWLATHPGLIFEAFLDGLARFRPDHVWIDRFASGVGSLLAAAVGFAMPLLAIWAALFWRLWAPVIYPFSERRSTDEETAEAAWRAVLARAMLIASGLYLAAAAISVQRFETQWLLPALFVGPLWLFMHVKRAGSFPVAMRAFAFFVIGALAIVVAGRVADWRISVEACRTGACQNYLPGREWAGAVREAGFDNGSIVTADVRLGAALKASLPRARILDASVAPSAFPPPAGDGACLALWRGDQAMPQALFDYLPDKLDARPHDRGPDGQIEAEDRFIGRTVKLYYQFVSPSPACR